MEHNIDHLFKRISEGDEAAFSALFQQAVSAMYPFIIRMVKQETAAKEVIQASFLRVWLSRDKLPEIIHGQAWLYKVAANECYTYLRKESREMKLRETAAPVMEMGDPVTEELSLRETQRLISEAVAQLPPQRRRIFSMSRNEGMNIPEIAQALRLSPNSVKNTLVLALRDIRAHLERNGQLTPLLVILFIFSAR